MKTLGQIAYEAYLVNSGPLDDKWDWEDITDNERLKFEDGAKAVAEACENKWVKCEDRTPETEEEYQCLLFLESRGRITGTWVGLPVGFCDSNGDEITEDIYAWQPLPSKPEVEG